MLINLYDLFNIKKDLGLALIYCKTVRAYKKTQGKNKNTAKQTVNSLLNTVNKMNSRYAANKTHGGKQTLQIDAAGFVSHFKAPDFV